MASIFSGSSGRKTAQWTAWAADQNRQENKALAGKAFSDTAAYNSAGLIKSKRNIGTGYDTARNEVATARNAAQGYVTDARDQGLGAVNEGYGAAINAAGQYYGMGAEALQQGVDQYGRLINMAMPGYEMYNNSMGLGGEAGRAAAREAFQTGPGYEWMVDQATSGAARQANKLGGAYSGNAADATTRLASNLANQEWSNWQKNLQGYQTAAQNAVAGQAGVLGQQASLYGDQAKTTSQLYANQGKDIASIWDSSGKQLSANEMETGKRLGDYSVGKGQDLATLNTNYYQGMANNAWTYANTAGNINNQFYGTVIPAGQSGMQAGQQAAANTMGAVMGAANLGANLFGKLWGK